MDGPLPKVPNELGDYEPVRSEPLWPAILELGRSQHWVVALRQLTRLGLTVDGAQNLVKRARLHRIHRGVYAIGRPGVSREGRWMAAVLACGDGALLSHRSAGALWGVSPAPAAVSYVTLPRRARRREGIVVHESATLVAHDAAAVDGIPCTSLARTLVDFAGMASRRQLARAVDQAERLRIFDGRAVHEVLSRSNGRAGAVALRAALADWEEPPFTRSEAERRLHELINGSGLSQPLVNHHVAGHEIDFWWPEQRFAAEVDGYGFHCTRADIERDKQRDLDLAAQDLHVVRITWKMIEYAPTRLVRDLADSLGAPRRGVRVA